MIDSLIFGSGLTLTPHSNPHPRHHTSSSPRSIILTEIPRTRGQPIFLRMFLTHTAFSPTQSLGPITMQRYKEFPLGIMTLNMIPMPPPSHVTTRHGERKRIMPGMQDLNILEPRHFIRMLHHLHLKPVKTTVESLKQRWLDFLG